MPKVIRRVKLRIWLFSWFIVIGIWSLVHPGFGIKMTKAYLKAESKKVDSRIDNLHK